MTHASTTETGAGRGPNLLTGLVVFLFFAWGFGTVLNDTLIPKLKELYALSYTEVMLTQFCFFVSYFVFSLPAGLLLSRIGYIRGVTVGLAVMGLGCLLFYPASISDHFASFLLALFVIAGGMTMLQVAANPFIELLGPEATSHSRLTLAQAFNSLATFVGPYIGASLILRGTGPATTATNASAIPLALRAAQTHAIAVPYTVMALILFALSAIFWMMRARPAPSVPGQASFAGIAKLLNRPRLVLGTLAIFVYVGAEVSIGSVLTNYLMQPGILALSMERAGKMIALYWGGAMVGRFAGAYILRIARPGYVLAACAIGAASLALVSSLTIGTVAAYTLIAVGLCNSIMFPTIFSLATEQLGDETPNGAGLLCMAIVGGAIMPLVTGTVADRTSLSTSLIVPALCYLGIVLYGILAARGLGLERSGVRAR